MWSHHNLRHLKPNSCQWLGLYKVPKLAYILGGLGTWKFREHVGDNGCVFSIKIFSIWIYTHPSMVCIVWLTRWYPQHLSPYGKTYVYQLVCTSFFIIIREIYCLYPISWIPKNHCQRPKHIKWPPLPCSTCHSLKLH